MKYKKGDRVSCKFGQGYILSVKEAKDPIPYNFYQVELDNEKYKGKLPWFAEHELKVENTMRQDKVKKPHNNLTL